ncbi:MAG: hypothetical protein GWP05_02625 [Anaerolineaceae bacterium]|nr:hypothetical protein [Anaerolineaceae bacterium]
MTSAHTTNLLVEIASLSREELMERLLHFHGKFAFDFRENYLKRKTTAQLRHILMAAYKHAST